MELIISIAALVVSAISLVVSVWIYFAGLHREKKQATLDAFNLLQNQVLDQLNLYTKTDVARIAEDVHSEPYKQLSSLLARCAHFSVGVNSGIYDRTTVRRLAGRYIVAIYDKMEPLIEKKRRINKTERHYEEFETLVIWLKSCYQK